MMRYAQRKGEHGSAILETFFSMILIGIILFGILQLFQLALADMVADYAAFRGARSAAVGFRDMYSKREALIKSVPASGPLVYPDPNTYAGFYANPLATEKTLLRRFRDFYSNMDYSYWNGQDRIHMDYRCPDYGNPMYGGCAICSHTTSPHVMTSSRLSEQNVNFKFEFARYPLNLPLHEWITGRESVDISSEVELTNHSSAFLE